LDYLRKVRQPLALEARPPYLTGASWRSRLVEGGVQPETGDEGYGLAQRAAARQQLQRGVGAVGDSYDLPLWIPSP
jgi:hypothetical protein